MLSKRRVRRIERLKERRGREREGLFLVEGLRTAQEALASDVEVEDAFLAAPVAESPDGMRLVADLRERDVEPGVLDARKFRALSATEAPQGVLLVCRAPDLSLDDLAPEDPGRWLLADGIQDPGNLGTLIRAARAFAVDGVLALDGTVDPWNPKAVRASAGGLFGIPVVPVAWEAARAWLEARAVTVLVADARGSDVSEAPAGREWALAVGSEAHGPREGVREAAALRVAVPMPGGFESLNAAVAGSILLYELTRRAPSLSG